MSFRRSAAAALAALPALAALTGCPRTVTQQTPAAEIVVAAFNSPLCTDPSPLVCSPTAIATPNDLVLAAVPGLPTSAQKTLLQAFVDAGGFPNDQAVDITIPIKRLTFDAAANKYVLSSYAQTPLVDPATLTTTGAGRTLVVLKIDGTSPIEQTVEIDAANCTTGQIALMKAKDPSRAGSRVWAPGRYVFAMRAGAVRTRTGVPIDADQAIALVAPNKDLSNPNNQPPGGLDPTLVARIEPVRASLWQPISWNPAGGLWVPNGASPISAFAAVAPYFAPADIAVIGTFEVATGALFNPLAPMPTAPVDSGSGIAPLPIDLLRTSNAGTTITPNPAFGPAAAGLATLDGFSETAMVFAPVTMPIDAATVTGATVKLLKLKNGVVTPLKEFKQELGIAIATSGALGNPSQADYVAQPPPIITPYGTPLVPGDPSTACLANPGGCSLIVGLQPGVGVPVPAAARPLVGGKDTIYMPPLEEATDYAVVITTAVKDMIGRPLQKATVAKLLVDPGFDPIATSSVNGKSLLAGISDETATALQKMRIQLAPVLPAAGLTPNDVVLAYTFRTQGKITSTALALVGLPYAFGTGKVLDATFLSTTAISTLYGIDGSHLASPAGLTGVAEVRLTTSSLLLNSQNTGAFVDPATQAGLVASETLTALVALPDPANVPSTCAHVAAIGYPSPSTLRCAPLVVFSHGLANSKADMLPIAAELASRGFIVAAIDAEKHGERSYCVGSGPNAQAAADQQCCPTAILGGLSGALCGNATCSFQANLPTPVDVSSTGTPLQIGFCTSAGQRRYFSYRSDFRSAPGCDTPILPNGAPNPAYPPGCLSPKGNAFTSGQQLVSLNFFRVRDSIRQDVVDKSALVKALGAIPFDPNFFATTLAGQGLAVDPMRTYFFGHSYGAIIGGMTLAANPRVERGVTYAGGATAIDAFSNPESRYSAILNALLAAAGIQPGTADYLKTLQIGKWILDPADPANFLSFALPGALPNPFQGTALATFFPAQPARDVLLQISTKDGSVPNAQNQYYAGRLGYPVPLAGSPITDSNVQWYIDPTQAGSTVSHGNPLDFKNPSLTRQAQQNAAQFLVSPAGQAASVYP